MADKRPALGRGLSALIPDAPAAPAASRAGPRSRHRPAAARTSSSRARTWTTARIDELARSIRSNGVIQPIVVRKTEGGLRDRRRRAPLARLPARRPAQSARRRPRHPRRPAAAAALIENIQREDLNPIEEAHAYRRLGDEFGLTQEQIAESVGKDRSSVANYVRLLRLPEEIRDHVGAGTLSMGHARALSACPTTTASCAWAARSCRRACRCARRKPLVKRDHHAARRRSRTVEKDVHTRAAEERLRFALGTRVRIVRKGKGGRIESRFRRRERAASDLRTVD